MDYKKLLKGSIIALGVGGLFVLAGCSKAQSYSQEQFDKAVEDAKIEGASNVNITLDNQEAIDLALAELEANMSESSEVDLGVVFTSSQAVVEVCSAHVEDDLSIGDTISFVFDDVDYCGLNEGQVEFNDEEYDYRSFIELNDDSVLGYSGGDFDNDFEGEPRWVLGSRGALSYVYQIDDILGWNEIDDSEDLDIVFLGTELTIIDANPETNRITVATGKKVSLKSNQEMDGVKLLAVSDNRIMLEYNGDVFSVDEGDTKRLSDGLRVRVDSIFNSDNDSNDLALLVIGEKSGKTVEDGDEYFSEDEDDPNWVWDIDLEEGRLAIVFDKSLTDADEALRVGEFIDLPENFARLTLLQLDEEDSEDFSFEFEDIDVDVDVDEDEETLNVLVAKGDFEYGANGRDANEIAWNGESFFAEENGDWTEVENPRFKINNLELIQGFDLDVPFLRVGDLVLHADLPGQAFVGLEYNGNDLAERDEDVLTREGFIIKSPEDNFEDAKLELKNMPEEEPEFGLEIKGIEV